MVGQPVVDAGEDRGGALLPDGQSVSGVAAADFDLNGVEVAYEGHAFLGNRRGAGAGDLDQFAARVRPAMRQSDARTDPVGCDQAVVSGIAVDLQYATKALQYPFGMLPAATGGITEFVLMTEERSALDVVAVDVRELALGSGIPTGIDAMIPIERNWKQRTSATPVYEGI